MSEAFRSAIFAGGGSRCFWQLGFWDGANDEGLGLNRTVEYAASTSAGCAMALGAMLDRGRDALELFKEMTGRNPANIHWHNLRPGSTGSLLPHMSMYREALERFLSADDLQALAGKQLEFLMAIPPVYLPGVLGPLAAFPVYALEKHLRGVVHPEWTRKLGFRPYVSGNLNVEEIGELIDIVLASSCVPPVLPVPGINGLRVLDGGLIDNVPAHLAEGRAGATLVLLSKRYRQGLPEVAGRVYVQPSEAIKLDKFDYADPDGLQAVYDLGLEDGRRFVCAVGRQ